MFIIILQASMVNRAGLYNWMQYLAQYIVVDHNIVLFAITSLCQAPSEFALLDYTDTSDQTSIVYTFIQDTVHVDGGEFPFNAYLPII